MQVYITRLQAATGEIACPQANRLVEKLSLEMADITVLSDDDNFESMSFRALIIAWLKACVLYVANGQKWTDSIAAFMRWSLYYDLWSKFAIFAPQLSETLPAVDTFKTRKKGPANMLEMLPSSFTYENLVEVRQRVGKPEEGAYWQLAQWKSRGYVEEADGKYKKTATAEPESFT